MLTVLRLAAAEATAARRSRRGAGRVQRRGAGIAFVSALMLDSGCMPRHADEGSGGGYLRLSPVSFDREPRCTCLAPAILVTAAA
eukprot:364267-Chlamydomonas_euryale.AAC.1